MKLFMLSAPLACFASLASFTSLMTMGLHYNLSNLSSVSGLVGIFAAVPSSTNYTLKTYDIGTGGGSSSSGSYRLNGISGSQAGAGAASSSANNVVQPGLNNATNANVPPAPTVSNAANYYDRLRVAINTGNNPTDTKYLIAVSSDNFVTTQYVQADTSIGSSQSAGNYQTYASWGGASGFAVVGLQPATSYSFKVKALQGNFTGSAFGPVASATTVGTSVSVSLTTTLTTTPPFSVNFTSLTPGSVQTGSADAIVGITSNAANGGSAYVRDTNAGLLSTASGAAIASVSADLNSAASGYGAQVTAVSQSAGGPLASQTPYSGSLGNVGNILTSLTPIFTTAGPITAGQGTVKLMAKASTTTPSAADYTDIVMLVIAMNF